MTLASVVAAPDLARQWQGEELMGSWADAKAQVELDRAKAAAAAADKAAAAEVAASELKVKEAGVQAAMKAMLVTTGDLKRDYAVLGPVYFQVSNKGIFSSSLSKLVKQYSDEIVEAKKDGQVGGPRPDWGFLYGEFSVGQSDFEKAFFVAVQELKRRAVLLGADAVIAMRQDIDLDTTSFQYFYLQMYGTAVSFT